MAMASNEAFDIEMTKLKFEVLSLLKEEEN